MFTGLYGARCVWVCTDEARCVRVCMGPGVYGSVLMGPGVYGSVWGQVYMSLYYSQYGTRCVGAFV